MALPPPVPFTEIVAMLLIWSKLLKKKPVCLSGPAKYTGQVNAVNWNSIIYDGCIILQPTWHQNGPAKGLQKQANASSCTA